MTATLFSASRSHRQTQLPLKQLACAVALVLHTNHLLAEGHSQTFNIPPQSLSSALNAYADAANVQLSYPSALAEGKQSSGLSGQYTPEQALRKLLGGSLIVARSTVNGTVTLAAGFHPGLAAVEGFMAWSSCIHALLPHTQASWFTDAVDYTVPAKQDSVNRLDPLKKGHEYYAALIVDTADNTLQQQAACLSVVTGLAGGNLDKRQTELPLCKQFS